MSADNMIRSPHQSNGPEPNLVLYHADCSDGFGAAWALWKRFPRARYLPVKHGAPPPEGMTGMDIVMVDFSYSREVIEKMADQAKSFQILDHHVTAEASLRGLPYAHFDMSKSGAVLAWEWAHEEPAPWLMQYIQDKDIWTWKLPHSREINAALASYPFDFEVWDALDQATLEVEGRAILRLEHAMIGKIIEEAVLVQFEGETVPAVYSPVMNSQIGERLCAGHPFGIIWHQQNGRRYFSLRSRAGTTDVGAIAARHGGGGHVNAAGFSLPCSEEAGGILDPVTSLIPSVKL